MKKLLIALLLLLFAPALRAQLVLTPNPVTGAVSAPIDQNGWQNFKLTLTQNVTFSFVIAPPTPPPAQSTLRVIFTENATGGFTVTFASNILNACTVVTNANTTTTCQFTYDGTTGNWQGVGGSSSGGGITQVSSLPGSCTATSGPVQLTVSPYGIYSPQFTNGVCAYASDAQVGGALLPSSYGIQAAWQVCSNADFTVTNLSTAVTVTGLNGCSFPTGAIGYEMFFTTFCGGDSNYTSANGGPLTLTTVTFNSATSATLSQNANLNAGTTNTNCGKLAFGPPDDTTSGSSPWTKFEAAIDGGLNCQNAQISGITEWEQPHFIPGVAVPCRGLSGGSDSSKYPGITGFGVGAGARILLPPWFTTTNCTATGCTGLGEWSNITFDTLGQAGNVNKTINFFATVNDGSYQHLALWGGWGNGSVGFTMNGGEHTLNDITIDGWGVPIAVNGNEHNMMGFFGGNGKLSTSATMTLNGGATVGDFNGAYNVGADGIMISVGTGFYTGYNVVQANATVVNSACWNATSGTIILHSVQCQNSGNATSVAIQPGSGGRAYADGSQLGGGSSGSAWSCNAAANCVQGEGNVYNANPIGTIGCNSSASPAVCNSNVRGTVALAAGATTLTVNTTAVTANSIIAVTNDDSLGGRLGVTCNTTINTIWVSARTAGTSFTITVSAAPVTNPECISYTILN